jgi:hypothetical protein
VRLSVIAAQIRDQFGRNLERASTLYQRALQVDPSSSSVADAWRIVSQSELLPMMMPTAGAVIVPP